MDDEKDEIVGKFFDDLTRTKKINREKRKLNSIIKQLDEDTKKICGPLIDNIAFAIVQLEELRELIKRDGYYETYFNGENQKGLKKSIAADLQIQVGKNYSMFLKQLREILPPGTAGGDELDKWKAQNK
ncbi:MAG: hypothetical protein HF308_15325 [Ignavibacteria bacterium]|jgi:hypothetical protein|nr:hypothetical protein [Ignavibacteria bacterium]MCU7525849.1 hypothetical protein [Ignavibacteria bacterium]